MSSESYHWLLLHYKLPARPSAGRVRIWRKLKRLGAVFWLDAAWVLPDTPHTREQFHWLSAEIVELGGEAALWLAQSLGPEQQDPLIARFVAEVDDVYQRLLAGLAMRKPDLADLSRQYQAAQQSDYFRSALGQHVRAQLVQRRGGDRS